MNKPRTVNLTICIASEFRWGINYDLNFSVTEPAIKPDDRTDEGYKIKFVADENLELSQDLITEAKKIWTRQEADAVAEKVSGGEA
jgi:hypothetical protein